MRTTIQVQCVYVRVCVYAWRESLVTLPFRRLVSDVSLRTLLSMHSTLCNADEINSCDNNNSSTSRSINTTNCNKRNIGE